MASVAASRPATPTPPAAGGGWPAEKKTDVVYASYDPLGNAHQMVDGLSDVRFSFDRAGRLTQVEEALDDDVTRPLKSNTFGIISTASNWANGKVVQAIGNNHLPLAPGPTEDQRFIETFTYGGVGGRVSHRRVQWFRACEGGEGCNDGGSKTSPSSTARPTHRSATGRASPTPNATTKRPTAPEGGRAR